MSILIDLFESRLDELEEFLSVRPLAFAKEELYYLYLRYWRNHGSLEGLEAELKTLPPFDYVPTDNAFDFIDLWTDKYVLPMDISSTRRCRDLLLGIYATFENSPEFDTLCARFELNQTELLDAVDAQILMDWFLLWMGKNLPYTTEYIFGGKRLEPYQELLTLDVQQVFAYLPKFILWGLNKQLETVQKRAFVFQLAEGKSLRKVTGPPIVFSKKMAHHFVQSPKEFSFSEAIWYTVFRAFKADEKLIKPLQAHFGKHCPNLDLLQPIVQFFTALEQPVPNRVMQRVLGYLQHIYDEEGKIHIKGWTLASMRRRANEWYAEVQREQQRRQREAEAKTKARNIWKGANYAPFAEVIDGVRYEIIQLTTVYALQEEGRAMRHCVGTYGPVCLAGRCSIWALREIKKDGFKRLATIEVTSAREIRQVRKRSNGTPCDFHLELVGAWAKKERLSLPRHAW